MKVKALLFICLCLATVSVADTNASLVPSSDVLMQTPQQIEISELKKRVQVLEDELAGYKKVKPLSSQPLLIKTIEIPKAISEQKKFVFSNVAPGKISVYYSAAPPNNQ